MVYPGRHSNLVIRYITCVRGLMFSQRTQSRQAQLLKELGVPMATALDIRLLNAAAILPAAKQVNQILDRIEADGETNQDQGTAKVPAAQ